MEARKAADGCHGGGPDAVPREAMVFSAFAENDFGVAVRTQSEETVCPESLEHVALSEPPELSWLSVLQAAS